MHGPDLGRRSLPKLVLYLLRGFRNEYPTLQRCNTSMVLRRGWNNTLLPEREQDEIPSEPRNGNLRRRRALNGFPSHKLVHFRGIHKRKRYIYNNNDVRPNCHISTATHPYNPLDRSGGGHGDRYRHPHGSSNSLRIIMVDRKI